MRNPTVKKIVLTALCIALCYVLPFITGQIPQINSIFSPMHIPILLCGITCGPGYAFAAGAFAPIFRSLTLMFPPMFPTAISMAFELATYGAFSGFAYGIMSRRSKMKDITNIYVALISAMILGRFVWGITSAVIMGIQGEPFSLGVFFTTAFVQGLPGIACHLIIVPLLVLALKKAKIII